MSKYEFCIPSYKRPDSQKTLDLLEKLGVPKENIWLSVQTQEDLAAYEKAGVRERVNAIIYRSGRSAADNRNSFLEHFQRGQKIVIIDDDIKQIVRLQVSRRTGKRRLAQLTTADELEKMCDMGFALSGLHGTSIWGTNFTHNAMFMGEGFHEKKLVEQLFGIVVTDMRFDPEFRLFEDTDLCARAIKRHGKCIGLDGYAVVADRFTPGGCKADWEASGAREEHIRKIMARHGDILNCKPEKENCFTLKRSRK